MISLDTNHVIAIAFTPIVLWLCSAIFIALKPGLRQLPGPPLARFTELWRVHFIRRGTAHEGYLTLHKKYGPLVRTAPNVVDISDPAVVPIMYGINSKYYKSSFYRPFHATHEGKAIGTLFSTQDPDEHKRFKRPVAQKFSMTSMRSMEYLVDPCGKIFTDAMVELQGEVVDLGEWLQWYAFDVIGAITFSKRFGFMESRKDLGDVMVGLDVLTKYGSMAGQISWLTRLSESVWLRGMVKDPFPIVTKMVNESIRDYDSEAAQKDGRSDFLSYYQQQLKMSKEFTPSDMQLNLMGNLVAGSDTTAISLRAIFYYLIKNEKAYKKVQEEIDNAHSAGLLSKSITYAECLELKYLQAVMKEAMRMHPGVSFPLERIVPSGGLTLSDTHIPAGTVVGVNPVVIHRNTDIFGADADEFRPERWLDADEERIKLMDRHLLTFGGGARTCIGKNISIMEMGKLVPQVLRQFDLEWASSEPHWKVKTYWLSKQWGLLVRMKERKIGVATS